MFWLSRNRGALKDGQVAGEQLGRQPDLGRTFVRRLGGERPGVAAELRDLAAVDGDDGRPDPGDRAAVGVGGLACGPQGEVALAVGLTRVTEQPERVGQAQPDQQFRVLPVAQHVRPPSFGPEALHGRLEVAARLGEPPGPVRGDSPQVVTFHPEDLVVVPLGPGPQPLAELAGRFPLAAGKSGHRERPHQRGLGLAAELAGEPQGARVHPVHPLGRVTFEGKERGRPRGEQPQLAPGRVGSGRQAFGQYQRAFQRAVSVGVGMQPLGGLRRPLMPANGLRGRAGVLVMQRDRRGGRVLASLEGPRGRQVRLAAARRAQRGIGGIADPAVAEVVGGRAVRADDPAPPQLVQRSYERLLRAEGETRIR